jgi:hypothetical protein
MTPLLCLVLAAGPFPLPSIDGKAVVPSEDQKTFKLPMRFEKVRAFYEARFGNGKEKDVTMKVAGTSGKRTIALSSKRAGDNWAKASVTEGEIETVVQITPVIRGVETEIKGNGRPLVEFVFGRSTDVKGALDSIDHTDSMRAR